MINGDTQFRCTQKQCNASIYVSASLTQIKRETGHHEHPEYSDRAIAKEEVRVAVKRKAVEDVHVRPNKIIRRELQQTRTSLLQHADFTSLRRSVYACRRKKLPPLPTSLDEAVEQLRLMTNENLHKQEKFCFVH